MAISEKTISHQLAALAARLRRARLDANLTQRALAEITGVSPKTISNAEDTGQVSLDTLTRLLHGLGRGEEIDALILDPGPSPMELARRQGRQKQRVRNAKPQPTPSKKDWQW